MLRKILLPFLILILWQLVSSLHVFSPYLFPSPATVWQALGESAAEGVLLKHLAVSMGRVAAGFVLAALLALPLGILCGRSRLFRDYAWSTLEFLRHVPPLAAIPLIILWCGIGEASKLVIIFLASFFPLFLNTYSGIVNVDSRLLEVGRSLHFSEGTLVRRIQLPAALPSVMVGLRISLGYAWRALIGAELIAASSGIGYMILDAEEMSRPDLVLVGVLCIGIVGSLLDAAVASCIRRALPWQEGEL